MRMVGLKALKDKLAEYVRLVQAGETILVTDREVVVAEIVPPRGRGPAVADALLAELTRKGWLTPPARRLTAPPKRARVLPFDELMSDLDQARADR
jgi:antitoxin (DNA-binding transcriptional repressor) of toxin-antitoxin stability system